MAEMSSPGWPEGFTQSEVLVKEVWDQADGTHWEGNRESREILLCGWTSYHPLWMMSEIKGGERQGRIFKYLCGIFQVAE